MPKVPLGRRVLPELPDLPDHLVPLDRLAQSGPQDQKAIQVPRQNPNSKTLGMGPPQLAASLHLSLPKRHGAKPLPRLLRPHLRCMWRLSRNLNCRRLRRRRRRLSSWQTEPRGKSKRRRLESGAAGVSVYLVTPSTSAADPAHGRRPLFTFTNDRAAAEAGGRALIDARLSKGRRFGFRTSN